MDSISKLKNLYELKEKGVISQAEYEEQSKTLLLQKEGSAYSEVPQKSGTLKDRQVVYIKSRNVYILLACMLGIFGIHNFYIGRNSRGIWQIICLLTSWLILPLIVLTVWLFVDMLTIKTDGADEPLTRLNIWGLLLIIYQSWIFILTGLLLVGAAFA